MMMYNQQGLVLLHHNRTILSSISFDFGDEIYGKLHQKHRHKEVHLMRFDYKSFSCILF